MKQINLDDDALKEELSGVAEQIIQKAIEGKLPDFEFIRDLSMLKAAKFIKRVTKKIITSLIKTANKYRLVYMYNLKRGFDDVDSLFMYRSYFFYADYYAQVVERYKAMIHEFRCYCFAKPLKFLQIYFFNGFRPDEDLMNYSNRGFYDE